MKELCEAEIGKPLYSQHYDEDSHVPYMYSKRLNDWVSNENIDSVIEKAQFALHSHLGGLALWTLDFDDVHDYCGGGPQPLLRAINKAIDLSRLHPERHEPHQRDKRLLLSTSGDVNPCERLLAPNNV